MGANGGIHWDEDRNELRLSRYWGNYRAAAFCESGTIRGKRGFR